MKTSVRTRLVDERKHRQWSQREVADRIGTTQHNVSRWERGETTPGSYFRVKLCELFGKNPQELDLLALQEIERTQPALPTLSPQTNEPHLPLWHVPHLRNPFFTGRDELLHSLHEALQQNTAAALTQSYALHGLGGIGKTQIALEYVYRYASTYTAIFWLNAETSETLHSSFVTLAEVLALPERDEQDQHKIARAVTRWLGSHKDWLLICDNVEDLALLHPFLPTVRQGSILLTTRLQAVGAIARQITVEPMKLEEGTVFLLQRAKLLQPDLPPLQLTPADIYAAQTIVEEMDGLPLALDQAGAYIEETQCSLHNYLHWYRKRRPTLLGRRGHSSQDHPASVKTTLALSFQQVQQWHPAALELLNLCAFLAPEAIPEEILAIGLSPDSGQNQAIAADSWLLDEAIAVLRTYSLIHRDPATKTLSIHRLVQAVLQDRLSEWEQEEWIKRVITALDRGFPTVEYTMWHLCEQLLPHILQCAKYTTSWEQPGEELASLLHKTGNYLRVRAQYQEAEPLLERALQIREHTLGAEHPEVASILITLGNLYQSQGKYGESQRFCQRAWQILEQALGAEHPDLARPLNSLGIAYSMQRKYAEAEPLLKRAIFIRESTMGAEDLYLTYSLTNLSSIYREQGRLAEAEVVLKRVWQIRKQVLANEHPTLALVLLDLGVVYSQQGAYKKSEPLIEQAVSIWEKTLGPTHPYVAIALCNLAKLYQNQSKYVEAETLYQRVLQIEEQALRGDHPYMAFFLGEVANLYRKQRRYAEAEPLLQRAIHIREQTVGDNHPEIALPLTRLGALYREQGKYAEAKTLLQRAIHIREQALEAEYPDAAESYFELALLFLYQGNLPNAQHYYQQALAIWEKTFGLDHPQVTLCIEEYAQLEEEQAKV